MTTIPLKTVIAARPAASSSFIRSHGPLTGTTSLVNELLLEQVLELGGGNPRPHVRTQSVHIRGRETNGDLALDVDNCVGNRSQCTRQRQGARQFGHGTTHSGKLLRRLRLRTRQNNPVLSGQGIARANVCNTVLLVGVSVVGLGVDG